MQPVQHEVVADVDDRGEVGRVDDLHEPGEQPGRADAAGEDVTITVGVSARCAAGAASELDVGVDHHARPARRTTVCGFQPSAVAGLGRVADEQVDLGRAEEALVDARRGPRQSRPTWPKASSQNSRTEWVSPVATTKSSGLVLLQHQPHGLDVVAGEAPVALGVEVAEAQLGVEAELDAGHAVGDLAGDELEAAAGALVVEQDAASWRAGRSSRGS